MHFFELFHRGYYFIFSCGQFGSLEEVATGLLYEYPWKEREILLLFLFFFLSILSSIKEEARK
jgi:hypothetical protein